MKIAVVGLGYVGLATMAYFLNEGHEVTGIDIDSYKMTVLNSGKLPIKEPGILKIFEERKKKIKFSSSYSDLSSNSFVFVCVGTPEGKNGMPDMTHFDNAMNSIMANAEYESIIIIKSTVPIGTSRHWSELIEKKRSKSHVKIVFSPEFLRQGFALKDVTKPSRVVFGIKDDESNSKIERLYKNITSKKIFTDYETAELAKYASNNFLALKISYINEISNIANVFGADTQTVKEIMTLDPRIADGCLESGIGFGGGCFVKDSKALLAQAKQKGINANIIKSSIDRNEEQNNILIKKLYGIKNSYKMSIAFVGLTFKKETSDLRGSIAINNLKSLDNKYTKISLYEPNISVSDLNKYGHKVYESIADLVNDNDVIMIYNERKELNDIPPSYFRNKIVLDGRNVLTKEIAMECKYYFSPKLGEIKKK